MMNSAFFRRAFLLTLGCLLFAISLAFFLNPASIVAGGVSGVAILLAEWLPVGVGILFLLLNLPLMLLGLYKFGWRFMLSTLIATALSSLFTDLFAVLVSGFLPLMKSLFLSATLGGALCGVGLGLVFRAGATTGGTDIGVRLLQLRFPRIRVGVLFFLLDFAVVLASAIVFKTLDAALYSTLALAFCSLAVDLTVYGVKKNSP